VDREVFQHKMADVECCGIPMRRMPTAPAMIKIKGEGGYPSRRRQISNTTKQTHPTLEHEPNRTYFG